MSTPGGGGVLEDQEDQGGLGIAREGSGRECVRISSDQAGLLLRLLLELAHAEPWTLVCFNLGVMMFPLYCSYC
jgi:hypothetical protein